MTKTYRLTMISNLTALALILQIVEGMIPNPFPIPGIKLGLANIVGLWGLYVLNFRSVVLITVLRTSLGCILTGTFLSVRFMMSGGGAIVSLCCMAMAKKLLTKPSAVGISVIGAVAHNVTQLMIAGMLIEQEAIYYYLPILLLSALPAGIITGLFTNTLLKRVPVHERMKGL